MWEALKKRMGGVLENALWDLLRPILVWVWFVIVPGTPTIVAVIEGVPRWGLFIIFLGTFAIALFIANEFRRWKKGRWEREEQSFPPSPSISDGHRSSQMDIALQSLLDTARREPEDFSKFSPSRVTVEHIINLAVGLSEAHQIFEKSNNRQPRIKVVALEEHIEFAKLLIRLFQALDYEVFDDQASLSFVFRAKNRHDKLKVRYKETEEFTYFHSSLIHSLILTTPFEWDPFPSKSDADFVQIELGGEP